MAPIVISRDSLDYERRGRIIGEDQYKAAIRARARELMGMDGGHGGEHAVAAPSPAQRVGLGKGASREAVLKIVSWTKDRASPLAQAKYAARTRESDLAGDALQMVNEEGRELRAAAIEAEVLSWDLKTDAENLSPAAKRATPEERRAMPAKDRLRSRQAVHIIFSVPSHAKADGERLGRAVDLSLRETFGEGGYRYLYTIHTDHGARPHAHIIAKAQSEPIETERGSRSLTLRLQPRDLDAMRQVFTRHAQQQGIDVIATRREDREHLRAEILSGRAPLRENQKYNIATKKTRQGRTFEVKAPNWYAEHGLDYERRRLAATAVPRGTVGQSRSQIADQGSPVPQTASEKRSGGLLARLFGRAKGAEEPPRPGSEKASEAAPRRGGYYENFGNYRKGVEAVRQAPATGLPNNKTLPAHEKQAADQMIDAHFSATHREPDKAAASFRAMLKESPRLALWAAGKHPQAFGEPSGFEGPGIAWRAVRVLAPTEKQQPAWRSGTRDPVDREAALAGERLSLRQATERARAKAAPEKAQLIVARSLTRLANRVEHETATDPLGKEEAVHIRHVARTLTHGDGAPQKAGGQTARIRVAVEEKATRYRELEEKLRRHDHARALRRQRERHDGGRER
jgi:hypothetical protein